jgi:hypothetical protein
MRRGREAVLVVALLTVARSGQAQFSATALYELGAARTDVGADEGDAAPAYGLGLGVSHSLFPGAVFGLAIGGDVKVRGFGIEVPGRLESGPGVFAQSDLVLDEWIALRAGPILAGVLFEQRRIDRGTTLGVIGFPASAIGVLLEPVFTASGRTRARFSYTQYRKGRLRLAGSEVEPSLDSGWSLRASLRHQFSGRWGLQAEYTDTRLELEDIAPTLGFFDHRQRTLSLGAFVSL